MLKKVNCIFIIFVFFSLIISGCSSFDYSMSRNEEKFREMVDKIFTALDNDDKESLKSLFAINAIESNPDIDIQIDILFQLYTAPKEKDEGLYLSSSESNHYGVKKISLTNGNGFIVTAAGVKYHVSLYMQSRNDEDKNDEGIHMLEFATEDAKDSEGFIKWCDPDEVLPGIYIHTSN